MHSAKEYREEERLKAKARKDSVIEGSLYSVSDGFGFRSVVPYLLEIGKGNPLINVFVGILSSVPGLLGNFSQIFGARLVEKTKRTKIISNSVFLQSLMWLALLIPGFLYFYLKVSSTIASVLVVTIYTLLVLFGAIAGPAWQSLIGDIANRHRATFLGKRNRIVGFFALVFALIGGFILNYFNGTNIFIAFIILFGFSFIFRGLSGIIFSRMYCPPFSVSENYYFSFMDFIKKANYNNFGKFTIYVSLMTFAVAIASPFFVVFLLKDLGLSYAHYILISIAPAVSSFIFMPFWGMMSDKYGPRKVIKMTSVFIPIIPLFWIFSMFFNSLYSLLIFLIIIELISGFIWAGFNLTIGTFVYTAVTRERLSICFSYFNILNAIGAFVGALIGGFIASLDFGFGIYNLFVLFGLSAIIRFVVLILFLKRFKEVSSHFIPLDVEELLESKFWALKNKLFSGFNLRQPLPRGTE